jgi:dethiobiotin synthetase
MGDRWIVCGIGTGVGKTVVSAILMRLLGADYWKPLQTGLYVTDNEVVRKLVPCAKHQIFPSAYALKAPLSPHHAARLEKRPIDPSSINLPSTERPLVIEMVGGILVPFTHEKICLDLFTRWEAEWILVSRNYLGSINHTLLTIEALQARNVPLKGIIFNGTPNRDSEEAIVNVSGLPVLGRLLPEKRLDPTTIEEYARKWDI